MDRLTCPVTGTTVAEAFGAEQRALQPLSTMAEPFDVVVTRRGSAWARQETQRDAVHEMRSLCQRSGI